MGKLKSLGSKLLAGPYLIWMLLFTVVPLCLIIYNAFTNSDGKFTFKYVSAIALPPSQCDWTGCFSIKNKAVRYSWW